MDQFDLNQTPYLVVDSLEKTLSFVESENAKQDVNILIVIQSFVQQITCSLFENLDPSK